MAGRSATVPRRPYTRSASSGPLGRMSVTSTGSSIWTQPTPASASCTSSCSYNATTSSSRSMGALAPSTDLLNARKVIGPTTTGRAGTSSA
ncbi:Uncharacterised protein [Mycobacteroides abscessus subsp. abscessus]|nr:Uncharacterised protein [Mycobacteroides abscessus subsp. abscessus]